jgi:hypothetical protein
MRVPFPGNAAGTRLLYWSMSHRMLSCDTGCELVQLAYQNHTERSGPGVTATYLRCGSSFRKMDHPVHADNPVSPICLFSEVLR